MPSSAVPVETKPPKKGGFPCCCLKNVKMSRFEMYAVALYSTTTIFIFADQNLMSPNLSHIADDFGFSEQERDRKLGGDIALSFFVIGVPISLLIGFLVDSFPRVPIFSFIALVSGASSLATYFSRTYHELFVCRAVTGVAVGGALPVVYSLMSDITPVEYRNTVNSLVGAGMGFGIALGQFMAGFVGASGDWRLPFLIISIPSFLCCALLCATLWGKEPKRGGAEPATLRRKTAVALTSERRMRGEIPPVGESGEEEEVEEGKVGRRDGEEGRSGIAMTEAKKGRDVEKGSEGTYVRSDDGGDDGTIVLIENGVRLDANSWTDDKDVVYKHKSDLQTVLHLMKNKTAFICCLQGIPGSLPWGMVSVFFNDFLSNDCGLSIEASTGVITFFGLGALVGMLFGGWFGQKLTNSPLLGPRWNVAFLSSTEILGVLPLYFLINHVDSSTPYAVSVLLAAASGCLAAITGPNVKAILQNVTLPEQRGAAFAGLNLTDDLGKGFGPFIVAIVIAAMGDRRRAFSVTMLGWIIGGLMNWAMHFTILRDEKEAADAVERKLEGGEDLIGMKGDPAADIDANRTELLEQIATPTRRSKVMVQH